MSLAGALPKSGGSWKKTEWHLPNGEHKGYFLGISDPVQEESNFPCKPCKGRGMHDRGEECRACHGSGREVKTKVAIRYQMGPNLVEEEWVTYVISGPSQTDSGKAKSPSTLWRRLKALSGQSEPSAIVKWYDELPRPIKVPLKMMIIDGDNGRPTLAVLTPITPKTAAPPEPIPEPVVTFNDDFGDEPPF